MKTLGPLARIVAVVAFAFVGAVCAGDDVGNDSDLVGGSCAHDDDCAERCVRGNDYPGGTCVVNCHDDADCPEGTFCIDNSGGVCLLGCDHDPDCRGGYDCRNRDRQGHGGEIRVCFGD